MTNDENPNDERMPEARSSKKRALAIAEAQSCWIIRISDFFRHSDFVIRHCWIRAVAQ